MANLAKEAVEGMQVKLQELQEKGEFAPEKATAPERAAAVWAQSMLDPSVNRIPVLIHDRVADDHACNLWSTLGFCFLVLQTLYDNPRCSDSGVMVCMQS